MSAGMAWAHAMRDGFRDSTWAYGEPMWESIHEAEGINPRHELVMAIDWIAMEPLGL